MPKKSRKSRGHSRKSKRASVEEPGIVVEDSGPLLRKCKATFGRILSQTYGLGFEKNRHAGGENEYLLTGAPLSWGTARGRYPVFPFGQARDRSFWFGASLRFSQEILQWRLSNVSLLFFQGLATDPEKEPLLRAEWDTWESPHAQPHWHVYAPLRRELEFRPAFEQEPVREFGIGEPPAGIKTSRNQEAPAWNLERFHYAMAARWHIAEIGAHSCPISEESLLRWIEGCVSYTRNQLEHIST